MTGGLTNGREVAQGVTGIVLHVANQDIMPVDHIQRAIGSELEIHGTEIAIGRLQKIVTRGGLVARAIVLDAVLLDELDYFVFHRAFALTNLAIALASF